MTLTVGVVGAGVVGLSAAINIQKLIKHVQVTVVADRFGVDTISNPQQVSLFMPVPSRIKGVDPVTVREWMIDSYKHHSRMATSPTGVESGQEFMSGTCVYKDTIGSQNIPLPNLVKNFHVLTEEEKAAINSTWENVCYFETVVIDHVRYLRWLMKEFRENGGAIKYRTVDALQELYGMFDVVVNCSGRLTRCFVTDPYFVFVQSRTVQLERQLPKRFMLDDKLSVVPHTDCHLWDLQWTTEPTESDIIMNDTNSKLLQHVAKAKMPQLEGCEYVTEWVTESSWREPPLVAKEMIRCVRGQGPILPVVHNVGLGNEAMTLAWGTGAFAAHLVQDCQRLVKPFVPIWRPFDPTS